MADNPTENTEKQDSDTSEPTKQNSSKFGSSDPTDGRKKYDWRSGYPNEALTIIRTEAIILAMLLATTLLFVFLIWCGALDNLFKTCCENVNITTLKQYGYFALAGLLGGTIYSIKYLYHAVARGTWHIDRQLWRFLTPLMSLGVAFIVASLIHADLLGESNPSTAASISIGFVAGYFSDNAIAKMYEIANVFFSTK